jgi:hypothetical protein
MRSAFEGPTGFPAVGAEADAELAAIAAYRDAAASRPSEPGVLERVGLWNSQPEASLTEAKAAYSAGDLEGTVRSASFAQRTWQTAAEIGRNRVLAIVASLGALLVAGWLAYRWMRDRGTRRRSFATTEPGKG